jgi:octaprenyl-diphosphate synthase
MISYLDAAKEIAGEDLAAELSADVFACEEILSASLESDVETVDGIAKHIIGGGGKRLRPILVSLGARAIGRDFDPIRVHQIGACVEMIHVATLIHDDVIDEAPSRRGRPTPHGLWGTSQSILTGDVLLAKAMDILARDGDLRIIRAISRAVVDLAEGEVRELEIRGDFDLSESDHMDILRRKTATFMAACSVAGGMIAGASEREERALSGFGNSLGLAFQIADDILDFSGDGERTGKSRAIDFRDGCATLPLIFLRDELLEEEREYVRSQFGNGVDELGMERITDMMRQRGIFEKSRAAATGHAKEAINHLRELEDNPAKSLLFNIAEFVVRRNA